MSAALAITTALAIRLAAIKVANGYSTDLGLRVFRGRRRIDPKQMPCVVIVEMPDEVKQQQRTAARVTQKIVVEGHSQCDPDNPNDRGHEMIADIKRAVFEDAKLRYGDDAKQVVDLTYKGRFIAPREDGLDFVSSSVEINVEYVEDLANP